jgi:glycosyltransferase involved in cell wall biosynthesis
MPTKQKDKPKTVTVVIPTYNEERNMRKVLSDIKSSGVRVDEIIVVDAHSKDKTVEIAKRMGAKVIYETDDGRRMGKGYALRVGMKQARGDIVVIMDADCSHLSSELGLLIEGIRSGFDVCMGSRFLQGGGTEDMPLLRVMGNKAFVLMVNALWGMNYSDLCYGYRSFRRSSLGKLDLRSNGFGIEAEMSIQAAKKKLRVLEIPSHEKLRLHGKGKLRTFSDGFNILKTILDQLAERS